MRASTRAEIGVLPIRSTGRHGLCLETQSREIMAVLVHDVVADAMRLGLHDETPAPLVKANGANADGRRYRNQNG